MKNAKIATTSELNEYANKIKSKTLNFTTKTKGGKNFDANVKRVEAFSKKVMGK